MKKKIAVILCVTVAAAMLFGACAAEDATDTATPGPVVDNEANIVVAEVNGEPIYYNEYYAEYSSQCAQNGIPEDDQMYGPIIQEMALDKLISDMVLMQKLEELGYTDLSDEDMATAKDNAQQEINYNIEYVYGTQIQEALGEDYTDEQMDAELAKYEKELLDTYSLAKEDIIADHVTRFAAEIANEDITKGLEPTEEEIKAKFDEYVAGDKEELDADANMFVSYFLQGSPAYYVPAGVRNVLQILVIMDEDTKAAIELLRGQGYDDQADLLRTDALAKIEEEAQALLDQIEADEVVFEDAALDKEINDDPGTDENGYPVVAGTEVEEMGYAVEFAEGALALEKEGDISGLVGSDFGYHILKYISDTPQGAVDYDGVHDDIAETLKTAMQMDKWNAQLEEWEAAAEVVYYYENM